MKKQSALNKITLTLLLLASLGGLISCTLPTPGDEMAVAEAGPRAWIDFPRDGAGIPAGASVIVVSHAYAEDGVAEVLLSVNSVAYRRDPPVAVGDSLVEARQEWVPLEPGPHTLEVRAYDGTGEAISSDAITVRVTGEVTESPTEIPVPTGVPTDVPTGVPTAVPTEIPTNVPTDIPTEIPLPTWTPTPFPPPQVNFWVDDDTLISGQCTTLHWDVEHATAVFLDGGGVVGHGTKKVCPTSTTTYVLHVEAPGGNVDRSVTITVSKPPDVTPPPVPTPYVPADGLVIDPCPASGKQVLAWLPVEDPSGVVYYVRLERQLTATTWEPVDAWGPVSGKQVKADVVCGGIYRWTVRAQDGVGLYSAWSAWSGFAVDME